jgi:hypothetical protein
MMPARKTSTNNADAGDQGERDGSRRRILANMNNASVGTEPIGSTDSALMSPRSKSTLAVKRLTAVIREAMRNVVTCDERASISISGDRTPETSQY